MPIMGQACFCKYTTGFEQVEPMFRYYKSQYYRLQVIVVAFPAKTRFVFLNQNNTEK
jgi:hypothetical protein